MRSRQRSAGALEVALILSLAGAGSAATSVESALDSYRSWKPLTQDAELVPYELAIQCAHVTEEQLEQARKVHGPHTSHWIRVYANPLAASALGDKQTKDFPAGAVIAKEKLKAPDDKRAEGIAIMIKHPKGQFAESNGWEFVYRPEGPAQATYTGCIACHRAGGSKDYVFGRYGRDGVRR